MNYKPLNSKKSYLITGAAGFIGYYLSKQLLDSGCKVMGIDNLNDYYDVKLKYDRLSQLESYEKFTFIKGDIAEKELIMRLFEEYKPNIVVNLAAQAGVRYSIENPDVYIQSNIIGFYNVIEACRHYPVDHLLYASSSSVYGANKKVPFEETDFVDHPVSLYASTKKSNELMAQTYSHLYNIPATGLRFFTVYGPLGRPDMAYFGFTDKLFADEEIKIFNNGDFENDLYRDFTYVDDIVEGIQRLLINPPSSKAGEVPHKIFNIGNSSPEKLMVFIKTLEKCLSNSLDRKIEFKKKFEPIKPGDVSATYASTKLLEEAIGFKPKTSIEEGLQRFTNWYCEYYGKI
ncbi:NAD dependent epimerase/dehydratase family protein [Planococcus donghaensis MPA1U2]|uniref:NAD dependent epimerase/dehydratase family protein n=1 Tax=Planococcus donghaensis MPA1U2 TaxID=933115 RepID=E7RDS7_9BACL|nr:GDP-mannose 4,6-dehydratase [Planococcus donghaensis]EGA90833.1 NAD dependent epimerase/dehydratase family protein [Planococcus donghaensis MPA1U2]